MNYDINFILFLIFVIIIVYYLFFFLINYDLKPKENMSEMSEINTTSNKYDIMLVISRYNENLNWLNDYPFNMYPNIIYNKGTNNKFFKNKNTKNVIKLKNLGKCDATYLQHIIENYDNLNNLTVFLPGSIDIDYKYKKSKKLLEELEKNNGYSVFISKKHENVKKELYKFNLENYSTSNKENKLINSENKLKLSSIRPFGRWFESKFGNIIIKNISFYGIFSVSKKDILNHEIEYYKDLLSELLVSSNPEVGHYFERSWEAVFYPFSPETKYIYG